jgi:hypothetical protein
VSLDILYQLQVVYFAVVLYKDVISVAVLRLVSLAKMDIISILARVIYVDQLWLDVCFAIVLQFALFANRVII